jgi:hypothetical protein
MAVSLFSACSTGNKFASSFGKRKYIKGYYMDIASNSPKVATVEVKKAVERPVLSQSNNPLEKKTIVSEAIQLIKASFNKSSSKTIHPKQLLVKPGISVEKAPPTVNSIQVDGGRHTSETSSSDSPFSYLSIGFLLLTVILFILFLAFALANTAVAYYTSITISYLLAASDIIAIVIAAIAIARKEDGKKSAKAVLIICSAALFLYLVGLIVGFWY